MVPAAEEVRASQFWTDSIGDMVGKGLSVGVHTELTCQRSV